MDRYFNLVAKSCNMIKCKTCFMIENKCVMNLIEKSFGGGERKERRERKRKVIHFGISNMKK